MGLVLQVLPTLARVQTGVSRINTPSLHIVCQDTPTLDKLFQDYLENEVLDDAEVVLAVCNGSPIPQKIPIKNDSNNWGSVRVLLIALAYAPETESPSKLLGIPKSEGPKLTDEIVVRRCEMARLIVMESVRAR